MTQTGGRRGVGASLLLVIFVVALAVVTWRLQKVAQDWLWQFFSQMSAWMLWVLVIVVPSVPVVYTVMVWWHGRNEKSVDDLREDV